MSFEVTVAVLIYNTEAYLEKCVDSLFKNSFAEKTEFLFIDDCSKDNSAGVLKQLTERYKNLSSNIKLITHSENKGTGYSREEAVKEAAGKYILFADSDDFVEPSYIQSLYQTAEKNNSDITGCSIILHENNSAENISQLLCNNGIICAGQLLACRLNAWLPLKLLRKDFLLQNNIHFEPDISLYEDLLFMTKAFCSTGKISFTDEYLYHYVKHNNSVTTKLINGQTAEKIKFVIAEIQKYINSLSAEKISDEQKNSLLTALNYQKLHIKQRILFSGTKTVQKKYISLWKETNAFSITTNRSRNRLIVFKLVKIAPPLAFILLFIESNIKIVKGCISRKEYYEK